MRTLDWYAEQIPEVERRILEAQKNGRVQADVLFSALSFICDGNSPSEYHARRLAQALGSMRAGEFLGILHEIARDLKHECESAVFGVEQIVRERSEPALKGNPKNSWEGITVTQMQQDLEPAGSGVIFLAVLLRALVWALRVPGENEYGIIICR